MTTIPFSPLDRKVALIHARVRQFEIAGELDVSQSLVSEVISGRRVASPQGRRVAARIAEIVGKPLELVFPELKAAA